MLENVAAAVWLALLIVFGSFVLNAIADSARRQECLMRGAVGCAETASVATSVSERTDGGSRKRARLAEHLKYSRRW
jgi:hypothetical protein